MKIRDRLMELPVASVIGPLSPSLALLAGSDRIDFCIEVFDRADQPTLYQALNGNGVATSGTNQTLKIVKLGPSREQVVVGPATGQEPSFPADWLARIHSTAGSGVLIWVGEICAARKPEIAAQWQANIADYDKVPGGWRRR
jgi:hypothetical protein